MRPLGAAVTVLRRHLPDPAVLMLRRLRAACLDRRDRLFAADLDAFRRALGQLGVGAGDTLYVRSAFDDMRSLRAGPLEIIRVLGESVGETGTLVMPTYPWGGLAQEYLDRHPFFDCRRTASSSGILTELFRRMPGTERSLHPTHPLAARGPRARWLTEGHERSEAPFDERSPFQRLLEADAMVLSIGRFDTMTLRHFADHQIRDLVPYPLYTDQLTPVELVTRDGRRLSMMTRANNPALACDHRRLMPRLVRDGLLRRRRVGLVPLSLVRLRPYIEAYRRYYIAGLVRHFLKAPRPPGDPQPAS